MKGEGSASSIQGIQSSAAIAIAALLLSALFLFAPYSVVNAESSPCGNQEPVIYGSFFTPYESDEYSSQGLLAQHFKNSDTSYSTTIHLGWDYFDDECNHASSFHNTAKFALPAGVTDWSIRYASTTKIEVWDDQNAIVVASSTEAYPYPPYTSVAFSAYVIQNFSNPAIVARTLKVQEGGEPPLREGTLLTPDGCPTFFASNLFDSSYEHAEYVDGLLRVHVRFRSPAYSGQWVRTKTLSVPASCNRNDQIYPTSWRGVSLPVHMKYFSFRMTSPTHWVLWDDETDTKITCTSFGSDNWSDGCEGDLDPSAPYASFYMDIGSGSVATLITTPFPPVEQGCTENCNSNVLFLPGIEASRLYRPQVVGGLDKRLWEPLGDADALELAMDINGTSVRNDIYTKTGDVLDEAYVSEVGPNVYKSFINDMNTLRSQEKIEDWSAAPYDWRLSLEDIVTHGAQTGDIISYLGSTSAPYVEQELRRLASSSRTHKVTIIAHSNGGLVAKALMQKLGTTTTAELIDKVIFVASPQVGTPQAVGAILHGYEQGLPKDWLPFLLTPETARGMAQNMPGVYGLLPSYSYFTYTDDPVIKFDDSSLLAPWRAKYGDEIHSQERLHTFLTDASRPLIPTAENIKNPIIANPLLLTGAELSHDAGIDTWVPPGGVRVIEIAGWGEDTLKTIQYYQGTAGVCTQRREDSTCAAITQTPVLDYKPIMTVDGDGTVVAPSALWTTGSERYWVNLKRYNTIRFINPNTHHNILEVSELRAFIENLLQNENASLSAVITNTRPSNDDIEKRLHFTLHSPLSLHLYDDQGNHTGYSTTTGRLEKNIPGSRWEMFGGVTYATAPASTTIHAIMLGTVEGSFTLDVEESRGGAVVASTTFAGIPSGTATIATLMIPQGGGVASSSPLTVDENGDGSIDLLLASEEGGIALPDITPPEAIFTFSTTTDDVLISGSDEGSVYVSPSPILSTSTLHYTITDASGNATTLSFKRIKEKESKNERHGHIKAQLLSIGYSTLSTTTEHVFAKNEIQYEWEHAKDGSLKELQQEVKVKKDFTLRAKYNAKKNETRIYFVDKENKEKLKETRVGLVLISIITRGAELVVEY